MTDCVIEPVEIKQYLLQSLQEEGIAVKVSMDKSSLGWLTIRIITDSFEGQLLTEREERIDKLLKPKGLNLGQYPIAGYRLLTETESNDQPPETIQLPLWSEILMAPDRENFKSFESEPKNRPIITTFYSFKGGVGRSTALGMVGILLATRNRRVVMVDFDLEAPGISVFLQSNFAHNNQAEKCGVLDYLYQRHLTPEQKIPHIQDCIHQIDLPFRGELFIVPVGDYDENYVHKLAELDRRTLQSFYKSNDNPVKELINDIKESLDPDVILIDARPGFNDTGAIALLDLADLGIICFSPTDQSFQGLHWVVKAARKQSNYQGKPDLRFLLTPLPVATEEQLAIWTTKAEDWIVENWGLPDGINIDELYYKILYNPSIAALSNLVHTPESLLYDYLSIANTIDASLPDSKNAVNRKNINKRDIILKELRFDAARAQDFQAEDIPELFQKTKDFFLFLSNKTWLIRGAKGTGKSLLFRLFVEQSEKAKELAGSDVNLIHCDFIPAHGEARLGKGILNSDTLASYEEQVGENKWAIFWSNYALLQLCSFCSELRSSLGLDNRLINLSDQENPTQTSIVSWLVERSSPEFVPQASDELMLIDRWFQSQKRGIWLLYDELDAGFGFGQDSYARRKRAIEALCAWWLETGISFKSIVPKIFIREDIWNQLNFTNKAHYTGKSIKLCWEEVDLWRLVLRQALKSSQSFSEILKQEQGVTVHRLETIELEELRRSLSLLWGERMGGGNKAYTYNWIRTRISDSNDNCFPRSLIVLLKEAVEKEKEFSKEYSPEIIIRPKSLIEAFPYVSEQRVDEVRNEYPELADLLSKLESERSPIDEVRLSERWNILDNELSLRIKDMVAAGIFQERSRPREATSRLYAIAELYLYGLKMVRKGQR